MGKYQKLEATDGGWTDWQHPVVVPAIYKMACCDCGLVHDFEFEQKAYPADPSVAIEGLVQASHQSDANFEALKADMVRNYMEFAGDGTRAHIRFRVRRNNRATGQVRGHHIREGEGVFAWSGALVKMARRMLRAEEGKAGE